jgi:hypothetical protein
MASETTYQQTPDPKPSAVTEQDIEESFIQKLRDLKYTDRPDIHDRASLETNFREKFEALNRVNLTDAEFARLLEEIVSPDVFTAAKTLRQINAFSRDDGTPLNYTLVNIKDWCKNTFEVVHQLRINTDYSHHRYDILLLINGVPCVQIELKTLGIHPRRAMEQIVDYKNDPGNGYTKTLLCFLQLFIVSNRDSTYYFANNNARHFSFNQDERFLPIYQFADEANKKITHLDDFADTFLVKCTLGHTISRYMVLIQSEQKLLMMRPYQVYAVKHLVTCIQQDSGNGFIWHTTGSGKTLTSFKAATLLKDNPDLAKCLFVVDRKDLDRQTREEFNRFQEGCVEENTNTAALVRRHGDTLTNDWDILRELNPAKKPSFDAIVANPPFSYRWEPTDALGDDVRFKNHGLAPKSAADFAFLLHGFHYLKDEGVMAIILPHGVLFRGGAEERIRQKLLKDDHIDTVIGLPANLFYSTGIPVCILVLKKCKKPDDVLFINAAEHFVKGKRQNQLTKEHITKIIETYKFRKEEPRYSRRVEMAEIEKNEFNLNISRYISTATAEEEIDLAATHQQLLSLEKDIRSATDKHNEFLKQLGLAPLPTGEPKGKKI